MGKLELIQTLTKHIGRVWHICWHPTGDSLASCGEDKTIRIWSKESSSYVNKIILTDGHKRTIREVSWSPCGNYLASASFDATTAIWDKKSGEFECNATLEGHENEVKSVAWSKSGQLLATCSRDKSVWVWEIAEDDEYECAAVLNAHTQDVKKVIFHPNNETIASCSYDNTIKIFKEDKLDQDWCCVATLSGHTSTVWSLSFDKTGTRLASCSDDNSVRIWKEYLPGNEEGVVVEDGNIVWKCVCTLSGYHTRTIYSISWCHLTDLIATACGDDAIRVFQEDSGSTPSAPTFSLVASVERAHSQDLNCITWNPIQPGVLSSCSDDGDIKIWKFEE